MGEMKCRCERRLTITKTSASSNSTDQIHLRQKERNQDENVWTGVVCYGNCGLIITFYLWLTWNASPPQMWSRFRIRTDIFVQFAIGIGTMSTCFSTRGRITARRLEWPHPTAVHFVPLDSSWNNGGRQMGWMMGAVHNIAKEISALPEYTINANVKPLRRRKCKMSYSDLQ